MDGEKTQTDEVILIETDSLANTEHPQQKFTHVGTRCTEVVLANKKCGKLKTLSGVDVSAAFLSMNQLC